MSSGKKINEKDRLKSSVAPNPKEPKTKDAKNVISALWNKERNPRFSMRLLITSIVPILDGESVSLIIVLLSEIISPTF